MWKALFVDQEHQHSAEYIVATKMLKASKQDLTPIEKERHRDELLAEASVMAHVGSHTNLVSLIGVVTRGTPVVLIVGFCEHGTCLKGHCLHLVGCKVSYVHCKSRQRWLLHHTVGLTADMPNATAHLLLRYPPSTHLHAQCVHRTL